MPTQDPNVRVMLSPLCTRVVGSLLGSKVRALRAWPSRCSHRLLALHSSLIKTIVIQVGGVLGHL